MAEASSTNPNEVTIILKGSRRTEPKGPNGLTAEYKVQGGPWLRQHYLRSLFEVKWVNGNT